MISRSNALALSDRSGRASFLAARRTSSKRRDAANAAGDVAGTIVPVAMDESSSAAATNRAKRLPDLTLARPRT